jgi:hypothetical protein
VYVKLAATPQHVPTNTVGADESLRRLSSNRRNDQKGRGNAIDLPAKIVFKGVTFAFVTFCQICFQRCDI